MSKLSNHITLKEAYGRSTTAKRLGITNEPDAEQLVRMKALAENIFEPLREAIGKPIFIHSMFRSLALNEAIGGAKNSQHMANNGAAMDIDSQIFGGTTNKEIFDYIRKNLDFDQLIGEEFTEDGDYEWIHVSYKDEDNRGQVLEMVRSDDGKATYRVYKEDE